MDLNFETLRDCRRESRVLEGGDESPTSFTFSTCREFRSLCTFFSPSDATRPRPCRDNRTISESPTEPRWDPIGRGRVPTQEKVPPNPPERRIGVTAAWPGQHLVGVRTLICPTPPRRSCGNPRPSGRRGGQSLLVVLSGSGVGSVIFHAILVDRSHLRGEVTNQTEPTRLPVDGKLRE